MTHRYKSGEEPMVGDVVRRTDRWWQNEFTKDEECTVTGIEGSGVNVIHNDTGRLHRFLCDTTAFSLDYRKAHPAPEQPTHPEITAAVEAAGTFSPPDGVVEQTPFNDGDRVRHKVYKSLGKVRGCHHHYGYWVVIVWIDSTDTLMTWKADNCTLFDSPTPLPTPPPEREQDGEPERLHRELLTARKAADRWYGKWRALRAERDDLRARLETAERRAAAYSTCDTRTEAENKAMLRMAFELCDMLDLSRETTAEQLCDAVKSLRTENQRLAGEVVNKADAERVIEWLRQGFGRQDPALAFTSGPERRIADAVNELSRNAYAERTKVEAALTNTRAELAETEQRLYDSLSDAAGKSRILAQLAMMFDGGSLINPPSHPIIHAVAVLQKKNAHSLANNLCPDHRDKQAGKPCLACEIDELTAQLTAATDRVGRLVDAVTWLRDFAKGHHGEQPSHVLLHGLTVDIPAVCDRTLADDSLSNSAGAG